MEFSKNELELIQDMALYEIDQFSDEGFIYHNVNPDEFFAKLREMLNEVN